MSKLRVRCAVCNKIVDEWRFEYSPMDRSRRLDVWCHGAKDTMIVSEEDMAELGLDACRAIDSGKIEGIAFTAPTLLHKS